MALRKFEIAGYRSIKHTAIELRPLNILIGANGAGKSNFVSFFKLLNEMMGRRLQSYIATTGRAQSALHFGPKVTPQLEGKLEFEVENGIDVYDMRLFYAAGDKLVFAEETLRFLQSGFSTPKELSLGAGHEESKIADVAIQGEVIAKVIRHLLNQCRVYHFHDTSATARSRQYSRIDDNRWLMPDAGNLAAMLYFYQQTDDLSFRRIESAVQKIVPDFSEFVLEPDRLNQNEIRLNWRHRERDYLFGPHQFSDGSLRAIALVTLLLQPKAFLPGVIILDEPELGLHPYALDIVAGLVRAASTQTQVVVATQSPTFLNSFEPEEIIIAESQNGESKFKRLDSESLKSWLEDYSVGELWERNVLGGGPMP